MFCGSFSKRLNYCGSGGEEGEVGGMYVGGGGMYVVADRSPDQRATPVNRQNLHAL